MVFPLTMQTWIALFRGINVGGNNILPMAELREDFERLGLKNVRTYIQSGNVVFESTAKVAASLGKKIVRSIEKRKGFRPKVFLLTPNEMQDAVDSNPFPKAISDPKTLHFLFLAEAATHPNTEALDKMKAATERYRLRKTVFYLHAPDGIGRSKLAAKAEKCLGVAATGRNYRTVEKLLTMAGGTA